MTFRTRSRFAFLVLFLLLATAGVVRAGSEDEVKALFARFVAAQNAHDLKEVGALLQDSAQFLWITRGAPIWGHEAALKRFEALYQGTWSLDPKMDELKVIELQPGAIRPGAMSGPQSALDRDRYFSDGALGAASVSSAHMPFFYVFPDINLA